MKNKIRRINLFSGSGAGKSRCAAYIFSELKSRHLKIEYVTEYIKFWTYIPRFPKSFDSFYVTAKQVYHEDTILRGGMDYVISDSPLLLHYFYTAHHKAPAQLPILDVCKEMEREYPSLNLFINRIDENFSTVGRYENLEEAKEIDIKVKVLLEAEGIQYKEFGCDDKDNMVEYVYENII
jgi:hypothetical protein